MYLIEQNNLDIHCNSQSLGKEMHAQLGILMESEFYPKLEKLFDQYDEPNHVWNINQLLINLPDLAPKNWKKNFIDLALLEIEEYLKNNKPITTDFSAFENNQNWRLLPKQQQAVELFFYYLKSGVLPENTIAKQTDLVWENIEITAEFIAEFIAFFNANPERLLRLIFGVSSSFRNRIVNQIAHMPKALMLVTERVTQSNSSFITNPTSAIKTVIKSQELRIQLIDFVVFTSIIFEFSTNKSKVLDAFIKNAVQLNLTQKELAQLFLAIETQIQSEKSELSEAQRLFVTEAKVRLENQVNSTKTNEVVELENFEKKERSSDFHFISNAGLVLLHPFLTRLFEQLNLCQGSDWKNKESQNKAILLTQFLVTGKTDFYENELVLNKIFCGMSIEEEVNLKLKITQEEKTLCKSLLEAVLQHWTPMNNSSVTALQETFLTRNGKLSFSDSNSIELFVESKGVDILLGKLPWGIGHIKTPWMEEYLICEWS